MLPHKSAPEGIFVQRENCGMVLFSFIHVKFHNFIIFKCLILFCLVSSVPLHALNESEWDIKMEAFNF